MIKEIASGAVALVIAGWGAHVFVDEKLASKDEVQLAGGKADYVLDKTIESLMLQIDRLRRKPNKTADDRADLAYLRQQLENAKKVRSGKK